jgi:hypothetical protein
MNPLLFALIFLTSAVAASSEETDIGNQLDLSSATAVSITGEASTVDLTTLDDAPYVAAIDTRRSGWFSLWNSIWSYNVAGRCLAIFLVRRFGLRRRDPREYQKRERGVDRAEGAEGKAVGQLFLSRYKE